LLTASVVLADSQSKIWLGQPDASGNSSLTSHATLLDVVAYFDSKTGSIMKRYGPGPRVHYHTGIVDEPPPQDAPVPTLRNRLVAGQELMLRHAADAWNASANLSGQILDVGCGLGGGSIFWAQEFGAQVTALTCVPSHARLVAQFAEEAGVTPQVKPLLCDAADVPGENRYDAAVAVDSSGYLPRRDWFGCLAALLRPGGSIFIVDCFLEEPGYAELFNSHWHTRIGTIDEYIRAANDAGLKTGSITEVSDRTKHFWTTTLALIEAESKSDHSNDVTKTRSTASFRAHSMVREGLANGGLRYALLSFTKADRHKIRHF
jgi:tocopherol O-methyltransferase